MKKKRTKKQAWKIKEEMQKKKMPLYFSNKSCFNFQTWWSLSIAYTTESLNVSKSKDVCPPPKNKRKWGKQKKNKVDSYLQMCNQQRFYFFLIQIFLHWKMKWLRLASLNYGMMNCVYRRLRNKKFFFECMSWKKVLKICKVLRSWW